MSHWNYVVTAHKPTNVTHSYVGYFTSPQELNLIIAKCTRIEIHLITAQGIQPIKDVQIYGRIRTLELYRPQGEAQDFLFIATERNKYFVLQWDPVKSELVTRELGVVSDHIGPPTDYGKVVFLQIGIIDPDRRLNGLVLYDHDGLIKVVSFDKEGKHMAAFKIRDDLKEVQQVLDMKFLYGCSRPTIAVLYQQEEVYRRSVDLYEVSLERFDLVESPYSQSQRACEGDITVHLLIPLPLPLCGLLIVGENTISYCSATAFESINIIEPSIITAYGRVDADGSRYLLGDLKGRLHLLVISHENEKVTRMRIELLGETSIASTISYLHNGIVYVGSSYGDSQLVKWGPNIEVLENYVNLGPIDDFCVVDLKRQGQGGEVVTCSGAYRDGSLRVVRSGIRFTELASVELQGIKGMWSLRSSTDDIYDTFLVVTCITETRILAINPEDDLEEIEIEGFDSQLQTLFCSDAVYNQLIQVTSSSVRLVSSGSGELRDEWKCSSEYTILVATANVTQVIFATSGNNLFYLEIHDGTLAEVAQKQLDHAISCLDINPIGENSNKSKLAAVGMWTDISVRVYSLPELELKTEEPLGGEIMSRAVLFCSFEGMSYLLCAVGDGHLLSFLLNTSAGTLSGRKEVSVGTQPFTLQTFSSKNSTHVFAASDQPIVIYSSFKKLLYSNLILKEVTSMCPFSTAAFPDSLAISKEGKLTLGKIDDIQKLYIRTIPLGEHARCICYQEETYSFAICSGLYDDVHFVRLLDGQTFNRKSSYGLNERELGSSIVSCSFSDDNNVYYCVGTAYAARRRTKTPRGRILVFVVKEGELQKIAEKEAEGAVYSLNAFNGKLLASVDQKIQLYKWVLRDDGTRELQIECENDDGHILALHVQTRGDSIVAGDLINSISLLNYKHEEGVIEEWARYDNANWMSALEILDNEVYLGAGNNCNLFTVRKNSEGANDEERARLKVVGEYHLGEWVNRFRHGSLVTGLPDSDIVQIPTLLFGTMNGAIGVTASLPADKYAFLEKLQANLRKVIKGVAELTHKDWRAFYNGLEFVDAKNFIDGDLIEKYLDLDGDLMEKISKEMAVPVEDLCKSVEELTRLY